MAFEVDTATDYLDLQARIETFAVAQGWTAERSTYDEVAGTDGELILSGPGLGGGEAIVVGFRSYSDAGSDLFNFSVRGFTQYDGSAWDDLPSASPEFTHLPLWDSSIPYWLMVNGQRILLMAKVSTDYMHAFAGFVSTYASANEYPYPMFIGACTASDSAKYSDVASHGAYWAEDPNSRGYYLRPDGVWQLTDPDDYDDRRIWPWDDLDGGLYREGVGVHVLLPAVLMDPGPGGFNGIKGVIGELDGLFWVSGFGAGVEDTVTVGAQDYVLGQNVEQAGDNDFCALELS